MAINMIIIKTAKAGGGQTNPMPQEQAKSYLSNILGSNAGTRLTNLSQALNQAFGDQGKSNGNLLYQGHQTMHASAGKEGVSSVTLFYYAQGATLYLFAMGEHSGPASYKVSDFGPADGTFKEGKTILLS